MLADVESWPEALQSAIAEAGMFQRVFVLRETDSTQDAARRMAALPGDIIVAGRQTHGRGRRGRIWADTQTRGLAVTFVIAAGRPERLMLAASVAVARAAESLLNRPVGIKWPNDVVVDGRKLAGVLVEQAARPRDWDRLDRQHWHDLCDTSAPRAYIGVGMNITQTSWPADLHDIAVSIAQLGTQVSRLEAAKALLRAFGDTLKWSQDDLVAAFNQRDSLRGRPATFRSGGAIVTGTVLDIDPLTGLLIDTGAGQMRLPAQSTSIVKAS